MRIVFSRKGFDSGSGGCASPVVDGRPVSLPIPETRRPSALRFGELAGERPALVRDLTNGRWGDGDRCHLDPDIDAGAVAHRAPGWRGAFGQVGAAQGHLARQGVGEGDLFLFFGLFRPAEKLRGRWRFTGPALHLLYGWLRVGERRAVGEGGAALAEELPWLRAHVHLLPAWGASNTVYLAAARLGLDAAGLPGSGLFALGAALSAEGGRGACDWRVPGWLDPAAGLRLSYHEKPERWPGEGRLRASPRGQEFVVDIGERAEPRAWLRRLFEAHAA